MVCQLLGLQKQPSRSITDRSSKRLGYIRLISGRTYKATCCLPANEDCSCVINSTTKAGAWIGERVEADLIKWLAMGLAPNPRQHDEVGMHVRVDGYGMLPRRKRHS